MSLFKKSGEGFLAKLFKHKQVEELAEELAHTYADEMQADMLSDNPETDTAEDTAAEPVPMLEVTESGEVDFTEPPETTEGESPPQDTEPSEVRKHLITFRVNDMELEAINRRYAETSFRSRGDFCRYSALMDLCGTEIRCAIRLHSIANAKSQRKSYFFSVQTNPAGQIKGRKSVYFFDSEPKTSAENCGGSDLSHNPRNPNISAL